MGGKGLRSCKKTFGNCGVDFVKHHSCRVQSKMLLCFAEVYWFIQIVSSPVKYSLMLGMDELLASVLVTRLDVMLLGLFLPHSAGGVQGREFSCYTTSTNQPTLIALQSNFQSPVLHLECSDSFLLSIPGSHWEPEASGKSPQRQALTVIARRSFTWYVVHSVQ